MPLTLGAFAMSIPELIDDSMGATLHFVVDDTSPMISYSPLGDTFSTVNLTAGWNPYFSGSGFVKAIGETGQGTSLHTTFRDEAALSITWTGSGIQLSGHTTAQAGYELTLDGVPQQQFGADNKTGVLASFLGLADSIHNVSLNARIPSDEVPGTSGVYFDNAAILSTASSLLNDTFNRQSLDDRNISFSGQWTIQNNGQDPDEPYHHSMNKGDVARATFSGASFLLSGRTSPKAGTYSVTLDNVTSTLSGRSSFTSPDTLLFFTTGLDPSSLHDVAVTNEDGAELSLKVGGFEAFAAGSLTAFPSPSTPTPVGPNSQPRGTIAALVLAGVLGFLLLSSSLFFFLVIRPRRRRARRTRLERRRRKEQEATGFGVLNIAPPVSLDDLGLGSTEASPAHDAHRSSGKSGFNRWKREMDGGFEGLGLGISFRHSDSTAMRSARREIGGGSGSEHLSAKSSLFTMSSRLSSKGRYGKGKRKDIPQHTKESSCSPSFTLELAVRPESSADSYKEKDDSLARPALFPEEHLSLTSGLTSLSYMNTPPAPPAAQLAAQSHPIPILERNAGPVSPRSVPRSVTSPSPNGRSLQGSVGLLLNYTDPNVYPATHGEDPAHVDKPVDSTDPAQLLASLPPRDRGSAQYSSDDATSILGPAAARSALRALSPRTSEYTGPPPFSYREEQKGRQETAKSHAAANRPAVSSRSAEQGARTDTPIGSEISFLDVVSPMEHPIELQAKDDGSLQLSGSDILDMPSEGSSVNNPAGDPLREAGEAGHTGAAPERNTNERTSEKRRTSRNRLSLSHLTPSSNALTSRWRGHGRSQSASFLDFSSSSDSSCRTHSIAPSDRSNQSRKHHLQSRWSSTVSRKTGITHSDSSAASIPVNSPASGPTSYFPYPTSLPPSPHHPEGHISSRPIQTGFQQTDPLWPDRYPARALRLSAFGPPTDSVPTSVTARQIRHSDSTEDSRSPSSGSRLPPHPPLPEVSPPESPLP
ncbi:hypothetical protein LshimejAT787_0400240 [Lyophyllum shimeji]|uniref:Uncharacterized protein n=1 Tax=Lyophyllum shimeji TaxID=47721 RepID=A0A9P3PJ93_LYOSH|nr:hypothetical protein LshimejAT787_0400240 [Lyophyllum shimeji]